MPSYGGGQKGGQNKNDGSVNVSGSQTDKLNNGGQKEVVGNGGQKGGDVTRSKIIEAMRNKPEISRRELSVIIGISPSAIQKHIEYLKKAEIIIRLGSDRKGLWRVLK